MGPKSELRRSGSQQSSEGSGERNSPLELPQSNAPGYPSQEPSHRKNPETDRFFWEQKEAQLEVLHYILNVNKYPVTNIYIYI